MFANFLKKEIHNPEDSHDDLMEDIVAGLGPNCQKFDITLELHDENNKVGTLVAHPGLIKNSLSELIKGLMLFQKHYNHGNHISITHSTDKNCHIIKLCADNSTFDPQKITEKLFYQNMEYPPFNHFLTQCQQRLKPLAGEIRLKNILHEKLNKRGICVEIEMWSN